ncbi:MAG: hypothetical protein M0P73_05725 [Syntrophobacterales bacterium]|jgi:Flp pilus assembly pilin Flp|nr:hypothetical protein [Syntrophobacterales bacterium]
MKSWVHGAIAFLWDEEGASAVEYVLLITIVALGIAAALGAFSDKTSGLYGAAGTKLNPYQPHPSGTK